MSDISVGVERPVSLTDNAYATTAEQAYKPCGMIHAKEIKREAMYVPKNYEQKPFEFWTSITDTSSRQYKMLHGEGVTFEHDGTIRIAGYIAVAMGQEYGRPGDRFCIRMSSGKWLRVVMADAKQYKDTKQNSGWQGENGHIIEMVVWSVPRAARGSLCYGGLNDYKGTITEILKEDTDD